MKTVIVSTSDSHGGAAIAAHRLMKALQKGNVEATMLVRDKSIEDTAIHSVNSTCIKRKLNRFRFLIERLCIFLNNSFNKKELFRVSIANTGTDISRHPLIKEADVIHLHWVNQGFLSLSDIQKLITLNKPIVWTMHDMWSCTSICHHARDCESYTKHCGNCIYLNSHKERDLSYRVFNKKREMMQSSSIVIVGCSQWIAQKAQQSALSKTNRILSIPNPIDTSIFYPSDKERARDMLHLPINKKLILFGAINISDERKGFEYLLNALSEIEQSDVELVIFGQIKTAIQSIIPIPVHQLGYIADLSLLHSIYNAVDLYVTSSLDENLPNTIMEAMACGTPCVGFHTGGIPEMIDHKTNGYVAKYKDANDMAHGITWVLSHPNSDQLSQASVSKVETCYSEKVVANQYLHLYKSITT